MTVCELTRYEVFRYRRSKLLLVTLLPFLSVVSVVTMTINQDWYSGNKTSATWTQHIYLSGHNRSSIYNNSTKSTRTFLMEYEKYCDSHMVPKSFNVSGKNLTDKSLCQCVPDTLIGRTNIQHLPPQFSDLQLLHTELIFGGSWTPQSCIPRHRVAVIIPYRNRQLDLRRLLAILHPMLQRQLLQYKIFIVEQKYPAFFNRASLMNVGFVEARASSNFDCFIFHDVDMLPEDDRNFYVCLSQPRHVAAYQSRWNYIIRFPRYSGGIIAMSQPDFEKTNGFSNLYYGWGGEDDDMRNRIVTKNMIIARFPRDVSRYTTMSHGRDTSNPVNVKRNILLRYGPQRFAVDGLNSLRYKLVAKVPGLLYTWLLVNLLPSHINLKGSYIQSQATNYAMKNKQK